MQPTEKSPLMSTPRSEGESPAKRQRESLGSFDCIGMNTISYSRHNRENTQIGQNALNFSNSAMYQGRYDRHWTKDSFPPPPPTRFSNKIVLVVDCSDLKVIHMNDVAARVLYDDEMSGQSRADEVMAVDSRPWLVNAVELCKQSPGAVIVATSDFVNVLDCRSTELTVSAFVQKLTRPLTADRCLALFVFERCHRFLSSCCLNKDGIVLSFDSNMEALFGARMIKGCHITSLLNDVCMSRLRELHIDEEINLTGVDKVRNRFPVTVVRRSVLESQRCEPMQEFVKLELQLYTSVSGLVVIDQNGLVVDCNRTFIRIFLGHTDPDLSILNRNVKCLIPGYYDLLNNKGVCDPSYAAEFAVGPSTTASSDINDTINAAQLTHSLAKENILINSPPTLHSPPLKRRRNLSGSTAAESPAKACLVKEVLLRQAVRTLRSPQERPHLDGEEEGSRNSSGVDGALPGNGQYHCQCLHLDGTALEAECLVSQVEAKRWALWLCRSQKDPHTVGLYLDSMITDQCLTESRIDAANGFPAASIQSEYFAKYDSFVELQSGRLGPIFIAKRTECGGHTRYVAKFLTKTELKGYDLLSRADTPVPREAFVLDLVKHPNIIECVEVLQDSCFYQLVFKHHGIDMIGFIALKPDMDEKLCSYLFQQLVNAVDYLHARDIVHRNVKAENVLIDTSFNLKLIDFSCAHVGDIDDLPFVGSLDYCPPEVLHGQRCLGKPSDIWGVGVTLFMLTFGFLPFKEPYSIIRNVRLFPNMTSDLMADLFSDIFCPLPQTRITAELLGAHHWVRRAVDIGLYRWEDVVKRGDLQTHLDFRDFQQQQQMADEQGEYRADRNGGGAITSSPDGAAQQDDYLECSPICELRLSSRHDGYCANSLLNRTIREEEECETAECSVDHFIPSEKGGKPPARSVSAFMRSLSAYLRSVESEGSEGNEEQVTQDQTVALKCEASDLSFSDPVEHPTILVREVSDEEMHASFLDQQETDENASKQTASDTSVISESSM